MDDTGQLLRKVKAFYAKEGRTHLPWRLTRDPYNILVSEVMLQQTQVERVIPKYNAFVKKFPTAPALAKAPLREVLAAWQGLGYNRRAKYLHEAAKILVAGSFDDKLPGVGPYTRAAVEAFAHNKPAVFIETNIRTVFTYFCFGQKTAVDAKISDADILPLVQVALKRSRMQPREFYWALMDYGAFLKASGIKLNSRSKHYAKQSKFEGSTRQLRGALLRELLKGPATLTRIVEKCAPAQKSVTLAAVERELARLQSEGLVSRRGRRFTTGK